MILALLQANPAEQLTSITNQFFDYVKVILVLIAVLILAYVSVRYWLPGFLGVRRMPTGPIQVAARFPLEPRKTLYIVKIGGDAYLMGASETDIYYFTALDAQALEPLLNQNLQPAPPGVDFSKYLRRTPIEPKD